MDPDLACQHTPSYFIFNSTYFVIIYSPPCPLTPGLGFSIHSTPVSQALEGSGGTSSAAAIAVSAVHEGRNSGMVWNGPGDVDLS